MRSFNLVVVLLSLVFIICGATIAGADEISITLVSTFETDGQASDIELKDEYAFIADGENGLVVIDVSDPFSPTLEASCNVNGSADDVVVEGDYAYVTDGDNGLKIIDISNPSSTAPIGSYDTNGTAKGIDVSQNYAYIADGGNGLVIIDVKDPSSPTLAGNFQNASFRAYAVAVEGDYAYVGSEFGLFVFDISDPSSPTFTGRTGDDNLMDIDLHGVTVSDDHAYSIDSWNRLFIDDVSNPSSPLYKSSDRCSPAQVSPAGNLGVVVSGDYAYTASQLFGIVNVSDPTSQFVAGYYQTDGAACSVALSGDYAYVTDRNGLVILRIEQGKKLSADLFQVAVLNPEDGFSVSPEGSVLIKVKVIDNTGNPVNGSEGISVQSIISNNSNPVELFDDGVHNDENEDDGIYANEWTPENLSGSNEIEYTVTISARNSTLEGMSNEVSGRIVLNDGLNSTTTDVNNSQSIDLERNEDGGNAATISSSNEGTDASGRESGEVVYKDVVSEIESTHDDMSHEDENIVSESGMGSFESDIEQGSTETNPFYSKKWAFWFVLASVIVIIVGYSSAWKQK